jgi:hypothetical protein
MGVRESLILWLLILVSFSPLLALGGAAVFYSLHHRNHPQLSHLPAILYGLILLVCGSLAYLSGVILGVKWACSDPSTGNLCGLAGFIVAPLLSTLTIVLFSWLLLSRSSRQSRKRITPIPPL